MVVAAALRDAEELPIVNNINLTIVKKQTNKQINK
jgi:hypothetical protein